MGVLHALMETDLKRVLAYSTIENVGIIFVALGLAMAFKASGLAGAAALALTAALFHAMTTCCSRAGYLGAGTVIVATGERNLQRLGGLIKRMPVSSRRIPGGSMAISALPPFNGFASEWLIFQSILRQPAIAANGKADAGAGGRRLARARRGPRRSLFRAGLRHHLSWPRPGARRPRERSRPIGWSIGAMVICAALCLFGRNFPEDRHRLVSAGS